MKNLKRDILELFAEAQSSKEPNRRLPVFSALMSEEFPEYGRTVCPTVSTTELLSIHAQFFDELKRTA